MYAACGNGQLGDSESSTVLKIVNIKSLTLVLAKKKYQSKHLMDDPLLAES